MMTSEAFNELRRRELIRMFWTPDEEREHDSPGTSMERVLELVDMANARRRGHVARLAAENNLRRADIMPKLGGAWRLKCDEQAGVPTITAPSGQA